MVTTTKFRQKCGAAQMTSLLFQNSLALLPKCTPL